MYFGFENFDEVVRVFDIPNTEHPVGVPHITESGLLIAAYSADTQQAFVLYHDPNATDGADDLFEVMGSYAPEDGLEGQWDPGPVSLEQLATYSEEFVSQFGPDFRETFERLVGVRA